jgi:DNA-binding PadR family transcriptional regulator
MKALSLCMPSGGGRHAFRASGRHAFRASFVMVATSAPATSRLTCMDSRLRSSPLALAVLGLLVMGPLHPYGMQRLIKLWGKDQVVNVGQRASLYKTIKRLDEAGLIAVRQTERDQLYPERTVYELTEAGRRQMLEWLSDMLAVPRNEFPRFPAALSFVMLLGPEEAMTVLERRAAVLRENLATLDGDLKAYSASLPRVTLLDDEYQRAVTGAELDWISGVLGDLRTGALSWSEAELTDAAMSFLHSPEGISADIAPAG